MTVPERFSKGAKHTSQHPWNLSAQGDHKRYQASWVDKWKPTFQHAEIGCAFSVSSRWFLPHNVARLVSELEHALQMQFICKPGKPYRFMRIA